MTAEQLQTEWQNKIGTDLPYGQAQRWILCFKDEACVYALRVVLGKKQSGKLKDNDSFRRFFTATARHRAEDKGIRSKAEPRTASAAFVVPTSWLNDQ